MTSINKKTKETMTNNNLDLSNSQKLRIKGDKLIAGFTQSMMKKPEQFADGHFPVYLQSGEGAEVMDVDGNHYIDYVCGLGTNMLGHNHPAVVDAISSNLKKGIIHSLPAPVEIDTAEALINTIPGAEMVRFFKTGADANSAAIRLSRFITKKDKIVTVGYNGWHDQYMFDTPGVPEALQQFTYRMPLFTPADEQPLFDLVNSKGNELAAVLLSVPYNRELSKDFFQKIRKICSDNKVMFIIDEVVTGFRLAQGGAQEFFDIEADMVTLSKGIAAGMPLSAVAGKRDIMQEIEKLQVSSTFGGEMLSLEVCRATLKEYQQTNHVAHIATLGAQLKQAVNEISEQMETPLRVVGYDAIPMFLFAKNPQEHAKIAEPFVAEMAKRGVLLRRDVNFICAVHTQEHIKHTINAVKESLQTMIDNGIFKAEAAEC